MYWVWTACKNYILKLRVKRTDSVSVVLWFLEKNGEQVQCEIRSSEDGHGVEFVWVLNGATHRERFATSEEAERRRVQLEEELIHEGWTIMNGAPRRFV